MVLFTEEQRDDAFTRVLNIFDHLQREEDDSTAFAFLKEQMSLYTAIQEYELVADIRDTYDRHLEKFQMACIYG